MHTMEAYTTLYEATHKEVHKRALQEIIDIVLKHMVDYDFWCGRNQFSIDFTPKPAISIRRTWNYDRDPESANKNPLDTTSYGHNIELIWQAEVPALHMHGSTARSVQYCVHKK